jgi:hypothetical protein
VQAQLQLVDPARARMGVGMRLGAAVAVADALGVGGCGMCMCTFVERLLLSSGGIWHQNIGSRFILSLGGQAGGKCYPPRSSAAKPTC